MYTHSHLRFSLPTCLVYSFYAFHPMLYYLTAMTPSSSHLSYPSCFDFTICVSIHSITMHDPHNFRASINRLKGNVEFHIFCSYSGRISCRDCFSPSCSWRHNCRLNLRLIGYPQATSSSFLFIWQGIGLLLLAMKRSDYIHTIHDVHCILSLPGIHTISFSFGGCSIIFSVADPLSFVMVLAFFGVSFFLLMVQWLAAIEFISKVKLHSETPAEKVTRFKAY
eukprot:640315_1